VSDVQTTQASTAPLPDIIQESERILAAAADARATLRLFGGVAIALRCPSAAHPSLSRAYQDLDFIAISRERETVNVLLTALGYEPDRSFNAIHGHQRLLFHDGKHNRQVDIVFDRLRMSHTFELRDRLTIDERTVPLAELLLFKLQIVEANDKDVIDTIALLGDHPLGDDDSVINARYIAHLAGDDWGLCHTLERSLERVRSHRLAALSELPYAIERQAAALLDHLAAEPKTTRWKLRARLGERVRWYELPEEVRG
jgi:hypothetical protein